VNKKDPQLMDSHVVEYGPEIVISEVRGEAREIDRVTRESTVRNTNVCDSKLISERIVEDKIVNERFVNLEPTTNHSHYTTQNVNKEIQMHYDEVEVVHITVDKEIHVVKEVPVPNYIEKEVEIPIYIEQHIEKIIEKDVIKEIIMEVITEKTIEIPIEKHVEVPIEKIIEMDVYIEEIIEIPVEKVIEEEVEYIVTRPVIQERIEDIDACDIYKYHGCTILPTKFTEEVQLCEIDNPIVHENEVEHFQERYYDVPVEKIIEQIHEIPVTQYIDVPVCHENIIYEDVHREVCQPKYVEVEEYIERPYYVDEIIEREVHVQRDIVVKKERHVEHWEDRISEAVEVIERQVPEYRERHVESVRTEEVIIEKVIRRPCEVYVKHEIPIENVIEVPHYVDVECIRNIDVYIDKVIERECIVEVENPIYETIEKEYEVISEIPIYIENIIEIPVHRVHYIDNVVEDIIEHEIVKENFIKVHKEIERAHDVYVDNIIEEDYPVYEDNIIEKQVEVIVERPVTIHQIIEVPEYIEVEVVRPSIKKIEIETEQDVDLKVEFEECCACVSDLKDHYDTLLDELDSCRHRWGQCDMHCQKDFLLLSRDVRHKIANFEIELSVLNVKKRNSHVATHKEKITTVYHHPDPRAEELNMQLHKLEMENQVLSEKINFHDHRISVGPHNYAHSIVNRKDDASGVHVEERKLRKSQKNSQNDNVTISMVRDGHDNNVVAFEEKIKPKMVVSQIGNTHEHEQDYRVIQNEHPEIYESDNDEIFYT